LLKQCQRVLQLLRDAFSYRCSGDNFIYKL
jgi:hypothetical protein